MYRLEPARPTTRIAADLAADLDAVEDDLMRGSDTDAALAVATEVEAGLAMAVHLLVTVAQPERACATGTQPVLDRRGYGR